MSAIASPAPQSASPPQAASPAHAAQPRFDPTPFTSAPLRFEGVFHFDATPEDVWPRVTDPNGIAGWFGMITSGSLDHAQSATPGEWGAGSKRYCRTRGMGTLDETIRAYDPPNLIAYTVKVWSMPIKDHLAVMQLERSATGGAEFTWRQYFAFKGLVLRHVFPTMMLTMMNTGLSRLQSELGGRGGRMRRVG